MSQARREGYERDWQRNFRRTPKGKRHVRAMNLKKYGLTPEQYEDMHERQNGQCASCGEPERGRNQYGPLRLAVDHDHATGVVRGLLCMRCNRALGMLGDSAITIQRLLSYRHGVMT